jgi:hypothetical protein
VKASVVPYSRTEVSPPCTCGPNWRPPLTFSFNHFSRTLRESRTKDPSDWNHVGSFVRNDIKLMRDTQGPRRLFRVKRNNVHIWKYWNFSSMIFWISKLLTNQSCGNWYQIWKTYWKYLEIWTRQKIELMHATEEAAITQ